MTIMEKNTSNQYKIRIEKALEMRNVSELRNNLYDLHVDNSLSDFFLFSLGSKFYRGIPLNNSSQGIKFFPSHAPSKFFDVFSVKN